jgi:hypothetical protein
LNSRLEAAPTKSLSNGNLDFQDKQELKKSPVQIEPGLLVFSILVVIFMHFMAKFLRTNRLPDSW